MGIANRVVEKKTRYRHTNESLLSIMHGLDIRGGDSVFSICGSGDQAFAFLEYADRVFAIDTSFFQVWYARRRLSNLKKGRYDKFFSERDESPDAYCYRRQDRSSAVSYFHKDRLNRIREKGNRIKIVKGDIFEYGIGAFNKLYLSNACIYDGQWRKSVEWMGNVVPDIPIGTLIYSSDNYDDGGFDSMPGIVLDEKLTEVANFYEEYWKPSVFRKVA